MKAIEIINRLNVDTKVRILDIQIDKNSQWNSQIISTITNKYVNIYSISIYNHNDLVYHKTYGLIK